MFADPQTMHVDYTTVTFDTSGDYTLAAIERAADHSLYAPSGNTPEESWYLRIAHQYGRRQRFTVRLDVKGMIPDAILDGNNSLYSQSCYVVFDAPSTGPVNPSGYSGITLPQYMLKGISQFLVSVDTADPLFQRVLNGET